MAARKISDVDLLRACLTINDQDLPATVANIAAYLGMAASSVHRRVHRLCDEGHLRGTRHDDRIFWYLRPSALDLCGAACAGVVEVEWAVNDGVLVLSSVE